MGIGISAMELSRCGAEVVYHWVVIKVLARLATVSVAAQNARGDYFHPIGRTKETAMSCRSPRGDEKRAPSQIVSLS